MENNSIIGTGLSGLVGSRIVELLENTYHFEDISRKTGTDITNEKDVLSRIANSSAKVVLHLAAKTDVDGSEEEKALGQQSDVWKINVGGTANVVKACEATGKKLIYMSTDMVFSGDQQLGSFYTEEDTPQPQNWYSVTKYEAEKLVQSAAIPWIILRIAYPYRARYDKKEYVRIFMNLLQRGEKIQAVNDQYFTPTFIDDVPWALDRLINVNQTGIFHAAGSESVSPYDVAVQVAKTFGFDASLISTTTRSEYFQGKAIRGFNLSMNSDKIKKLEVRLHTLREGLEEIKNQM